MLDDFLSDSLHFPRQIDGASDLFRNPRFFAACAVEHVKGPPRMRLKHACNELGLRAAPMTDGATRLGALFVHAGSESQHGLAGKLKSPYQLAGCNPGDDIQSLMLAAISVCRARRIISSRSLPGGRALASLLTLRAIWTFTQRGCLPHVVSAVLHGISPSAQLDY
jgi:hypothetical protein